jgi:hypothetical protein
MNTAEQLTAASEQASDNGRPNKENVRKQNNKPNKKPKICLRARSEGKE